VPRISVILPNYNYARYLKERVRSILRQTFRDLELLYLDDASTDNSNAVMQTFTADPRVRMHCFDQNSGKVYQRWNDGAKLATGDWLWFAGADDSAHPRFLERLLEIADLHTGAGIVHCRPMHIDTDGQIVGLRYPGTDEEVARLSRDHFNRGYQQIAPLTSANYIFTASALLLRRDAFEALGGFDTRLWLCADWHLYLELLRTYDIAFTAEPLACYRFHRQTVTITTRHIDRMLESGYCLACAYLAMKDDTRHTDDERNLVLLRIRALLGEAFSDPFVPVPAALQFAADTIYQVVPDRRLKRIGVKRAS
jgi:glycosyltransferase involved in cell wall biosynthesis